MSTTKQVLIMLMAGFLGGIMGSAVMNPQAMAAIARGEFFDASFYNQRGKMVGFIGPGDGAQGMIFLFDPQGKPRVQLGTYPTGGEKGQSLIGLSDRKDNLRFLFRLHGSYDSPTLVMKDQSGHDRIVIGLDGETQEPYFYVSGKGGMQKNLIK